MEATPEFTSLQKEGKQMFYIKIRNGLHMNRTPLVSEATALPTEPNHCQIINFFFFLLSILIDLALKPLTYFCRNLYLLQKMFYNIDCRFVWTRFECADVRWRSAMKRRGDCLLDKACGAL